MTAAEAAALAVAGRLLAYPDRDFFASLQGLREEAREFARESPDAAAFAGAALAFADQLENLGQAQAAEQYVAIFDHSSAATLYMAWLRYGNDRGQGRALAALNGLYRAYGFEPRAGALPDYLPQMLEFLAFAPDEARDILLDGFGAEMNDLLRNMEKMRAVQAPMLAAALAPLKRDFAARFQPRQGYDSTMRPMARPEPEPDETPAPPILP